MKRRDFLGVLGAAAAMWPVDARAQQTKMPVVGVLIPANPSPFWSTFQEAMKALGYVDGQNIRFDFRSAEGKANLLGEIAAEFVRSKVDVIVAAQTPAVTAAKQATTEIPIVMAAAADPVGTGLVQSLARPGGNITGMSATVTEMGEKVLELIRELLPATTRIAVLANATDPFPPTFLKQLETGGRSFAMSIHDPGD